MSTNVNSLLASVTKLNGENYSDYKFDMVMIFRRAGTLKMAIGEIKKPSDKAAAEAKEEWEDQSENVLSAIGLTIEQSQKQYIRDCTDGPSAWKALKDIYEKNTASQRINLKRRFFSYQNPAGSMADFIGDITNLASKLRAIGVDLEDQDVTDVMIYSLPPAYGSVATALMNRSDAASLRITDVSAALMEEEARQNLKDDSQSDVALAARILKASCGNCHKKGHTTAECWSKGGGGKKKCFACLKEGHLAKDCPQNTDKANFSYGFSDYIL
jgi:hypothetical protein